MTKKEILEELKNNDLPRLRDSIFNYIEQHRPRWYRLLLREIFKYPKSVRSLDNTKGNPLGITGSLSNIVDVTPIQEKIGNVNAEYGQNYVRVHLRRVDKKENKRNIHSIKYSAPLSSNLGAQQVLFYDDQETYLSIQIRMKIKNKWIVIGLEKNDIRIIDE